MQQRAVVSRAMIGAPDIMHLRVLVENLVLQECRCRFRRARMYKDARQCCLQFAVFSAGAKAIPTQALLQRGPNVCGGNIPTMRFLQTIMTGCSIDVFLKRLQ